MKIQAIFTQVEVEQINAVQDIIVQAICENYEFILSNLDKSELTIKTYTRNAKSFIAFIQKNGININSFAAFKKELLQLTQISNKTKNIYLAATKALLKECVRYGILPIDITLHVRSLRIPQEHVKDGLNQEEVNRIENYLQTISKPRKRRRLLAMFYLLAWQGIRQFEVLNLKVEDLNLQDATGLIQQKGLDSKVLIDFHPQVVEALNNYLEITQKKSGYLFTSTTKIISKNNRPISTRSLRKIWTCPQYGIFVKCGIAHRSVHGFRHYFVTTLLKVTGGDILTVQYFSRHKSIQALKMYDDRRKKRDLLPKFYAAFGQK